MIFCNFGGFADRFTDRFADRFTDEFSGRFEDFDGFTVEINEFQ